MPETLTKMMPLFLFKTDDLKNQFSDEKLDMRLRVILYALAGFVYHNFGKNITITEVFRTQEMQNEYYKNDPVYQQKPFFSTHQYWRAVDVSIIYFTDSEISQMANFLNHFEYGKPEIQTAKFHDIGLGRHLHLQVSANSFTNII